MTTEAMISLGDSVLMSGHVPRQRIAVSHGTSIFTFLIFKCIPVVFSRVDVTFLAAGKDSISAIFSPTLAITFFLYLFFVIFFIVLGNKHPNKHEMRALSDGDLSVCGDQ